MKRINRLAVILFIISIFLSLFLAGWFVYDVIMQDGLTCGFASVYLEIGGETVCKSFLLDYITSVFISILYLNFFISPLYIFIIYLNARRWKNNKRINNEDIIYQRELPNYNAAIAAYLLDGIIEVDRDYDALLFELIERGIIKKDKDKYVIKNVNESLFLVMESEKYVIKTLNSKINKRKFKLCILKDVTNLGLATKANLPIIGFLLALLFCNQFYLIILGFIYFKTSLLQELAYKLTTKGSIEKDKILKLKAFLHNFSKLSDVKKLEHNIWDRYLSFAIALDENDFLKR